MRSGRISGRQDPVLDYRMEKYPGKSGVPECYSEPMALWYLVELLVEFSRRMYIAG